ncbi:MAG: lipocalin family protein [Bacteroidetes bacterium]|nr:lipocalin family protein [Bacteroidota bacterium]
MGEKKQKENVWKTILIGVVVSLLGFFIIQFITDKKNNSKNFKAKKEANEKAWADVNDYLQNAQKKFENIACFSCDYEKMKNELIRELDQDGNSLRNLKEESLIDQKIKTVIDRTIGRMEGLKPVFKNFFDSLSVILKDNPENPDVARTTKISQDFFSTKERLDTADNAEIDRLLSEINKEYKLNLTRIEVKPEINFNQLPGKWNVECKFKIEFNTDGKVSVIFDSETINGKWSRTNDRLTVTLDNGENIQYYILQLNETVLRLQQNETGSFPIGACRER